MKTIISEQLANIETIHKIKILYACESGSRAWGFPSPDSDYDVRFIYIRSLEDYLSIKSYDDYLNFPLNDELDINGWDIQKALKLINKSNTTVFEWLQSPITYHIENNFKDNLWRFCRHYFCPRSNIHHYLGIAKGAAASIEKDEVKIKKLFYVLRPLLAALWCIEQRSIAPMSIIPLMDLLPKDLRLKVISLIEIKATANEGSIIQIDNDLKRWIDETYSFCSEKSSELEKVYFDTDLANTFFRKTIEQYDYTRNKR